MPWVKISWLNQNSNPNRQNKSTSDSDVLNLRNSQKVPKVSWALEFDSLDVRILCFVVVTFSRNLSRILWDRKNEVSIRFSRTFFAKMSLDLTTIYSGRFMKIARFGCGRIKTAQMVGKYVLDSKLCWFSWRFLPG